MASVLGSKLIQRIEEDGECTVEVYHLAAELIGIVTTEVRTRAQRGSGANQISSMLFQATRELLSEMEKLGPILRCPECEYVGELQSFDCMGADPNCVFCPACHSEFCIEDNTTNP